MPKSGSVDEGRRLALLSRLVDILGEEEAETLMESLPPVPWDRLATKDDLHALEKRLRTEMNSRFEKMEGEMKAMEGRLMLEMSKLSRTVIFAIIGFSLTTILSVVGMGLALALT